MAVDAQAAAATIVHYDAPIRVDLGEGRVSGTVALTAVGRECVHDKALVFPDWSRPTAADRVIVCHKGAYVLHLLREQLGER